MPTVIHQKVRDCRAGTHSQSVCRVKSGWVVMGDVQFLKGYVLVLPDPVVPDLNYMSFADRAIFLHEMTLVGDALLELTDACRINYEILGNLEPALHGHVFPRYANEPENLRTSPVWFYDWKSAPPFDPVREAGLMHRLREFLSKADSVV